MRRCATWCPSSDDRLSISLLTREYPPSIYGGAGVHVALLVPQLRKLIDVDVQCMGEPREGATAHAENYPAGRERGAAGLRRRPVDGRGGPEVDLVHSHTWYANLAGHLASCCTDIPHVVSAHSLEPHRPWKAEQLGGGYRLSSWAERTAFEAADAVIAVSAGMRTTSGGLPDLDPDKVHVVNNGIDTDEFAPDSGHRHRHRPGHRPRPAVGRLRRPDHPAEGCDPPAAGRLAARPRHAAGAAGRRGRHPGDRPQIGEAIAQLQASRGGVLWSRRCCRGRGPAGAVPRHVFVCPSVYEPLGIVNLEAMACETAVVASAVGGIPEVVVDGETG